MAIKLFQVQGGFSDGNISYLSGAGAPGGDGAAQDDAKVGSVYEDTVSLAKYRKVTAGVGTIHWKVAVAASDSTSREINQVAHGFVVGDWLYADPLGGYSKALGDNVATSDVIGIVDSVVDVDNFVMVTAGYTTISSADTNGSALFLDGVTAGAHTLTKPNIGIQKNLGFVTEGLLFVAIDITIEISAGDAPGVPLVIVTNVTTVIKADSVIVKDHGSVVWMVEVSDDANAERYTCTINAAHNGTTTIDASAADFAESGIVDFPFNAAIPGLSIGVGLVGTGATQEMELQVASTNTTKVAARRISV